MITTTTTTTNKRGVGEGFCPCNIEVLRKMGSQQHTQKIDTHTRAHTHTHTHTHTKLKQTGLKQFVSYLKGISGSVVRSSSGI